MFFKFGYFLFTFYSRSDFKLDEFEIFWKCREWVGKAISAFLLWMVATMLKTRRSRTADKHNKIVIYTEYQTTMECIVSVQQGIRTMYDMVQRLNVTILKIWSVMVSHTPKVLTTTLPHSLYLCILT